MSARTGWLSPPRLSPITKTASRSAGARRRRTWCPIGEFELRCRTGIYVSTALGARSDRKAEGRSGHPRPPGRRSSPTALRSPQTPPRAGATPATVSVHPQSADDGSHARCACNERSSPGRSRSSAGGPAPAGGSGVDFGVLQQRGERVPTRLRAGRLVTADRVCDPNERGAERFHPDAGLPHQNREPTWTGRRVVAYNGLACGGLTHRA